MHTKPEHRSQAYVRAEQQNMNDRWHAVYYTRMDKLKTENIMVSTNHEHYGIHKPERHIKSASSISHLKHQRGQESSHFFII